MPAPHVSITTSSGGAAEIPEDKKMEFELLKLRAMVEDIYSNCDIPNKKCNICNKEFMFWGVFSPGQYKRFAACPHCGSLERQRILWFYINNENIIKNKKIKLLHFAPEKCLFDIFSNNPLIDYYPVDFSPDYPNIRDVVDIQDIPYEDKIFDLIICIHVLECVPNEQKAISELKRVLKLDGTAFIMSSVFHGSEKTLENPDYNTPELRLKHYTSKIYQRKYGRDFAERIQMADLFVETIDYYKNFSKQEFSRYGFRASDKIYKATHTGSPFEKSKQKISAKSVWEFRLIAPNYADYSGFIPFTPDEINKYEKQPSGNKYKTFERKNADNTMRFQLNSGGEGYINPKANPTKIAKIMCVGDLMGEPKMQAAAFWGEGFNFTGSFDYVKPILETSDLVIGNLETTICQTAPYAMEQHLIGGDFHCNSPVELLDALRYGGFDALVLANNHNLDCGINGIKETLLHLNKYGFGNTGLSLPRHKNRYLLMDVNGIKLGILSYSTSFNKKDENLTEEGINIFLNKYSQDQVRQDIVAAKQAGAEFILVYMHWGAGTCYSYQVGEYPVKYAKRIADVGADYIVGSHPHVLQKYDVIKSTDGRKVPVAYSIGNFLTSDMRSVTRDTIILNLTLKKENEEIKIVDESYIPCHVFDHYLGNSYPIIPAISKLNGGLRDDILTKTLELSARVLGDKINIWTGDNY